MSGEYAYRAPTLELRFGTEDQVSPDAIADVPVPANVGVFLGDTFAAGSLSSQLTPINVEKGLWKAPFRFEHLPLGDLNLSKYEEYPSFGDFSVSYLYRSKLGSGMPFTLSKESPSQDDLLLEDNYFREDGGAELSVRLLCSGNGLSGSPLIDVYGPHAAPTQDAPYHISYSYAQPLENFGRVYARFTDLRAGEYNLYGSQGSTLFFDGLPAGSEEVRVGPASTPPQVDCYLNVMRPNAPAGASQLVLAQHRGVINFTIQFTGLVTWQGDLVVVAEPELPLAGAGPAWCYLIPGSVQFGKTLKGSLGYLDAHRYSVMVYRLAEDNLSPPELVGSAVEEVELVLPPEQTMYDYAGNPYLYQPEAVASVVLKLAL